MDKSINTPKSVDLRNEQAYGLFGPQSYSSQCNLTSLFAYPFSPFLINNSNLVQPENDINDHERHRAESVIIEEENDLNPRIILNTNQNNVTENNNLEQNVNGEYFLHLHNTMDNFKQKLLNHINKEVQELQKTLMSKNKYTIFKSKNYHNGRSAVIDNNNTEIDDNVTIVDNATVYDDDEFNDCLSDHFNVTNFTSVTNSRPKFNCDLCKKSFSNHLTLQNHKNKMHVKNSSLICKFCNKSYKMQHHYENHVRSIVNGKCPKVRKNRQ